MNYDQWKLASPDYTEMVSRCCGAEYEEIYSEMFDELGVKYQNIIVEGTERVIIGDLLGLMKRISRAVGFKKEFSFIPVDFDF